MRLLAPLALLVTMLLTAAPALAGDNGEGLVGETDDKIITFFSPRPDPLLTAVLVLCSR